MAKDKTGFNPDREQNEMRHVEVELDLPRTPSPRCSTAKAHRHPGLRDEGASLPRWFPVTRPRAGFTPSTACCGSTDSRFRRERNGAKGRTQEIERLIARSLRAAVDLEALGPVAINVDCDVLNADGGTRCASIAAAGIALRLAVRRLIASGDCLGGPASFRRRPPQRMDGPKLTDVERANHEMAVMPNELAAISVGLLESNVWLDLDYHLDSRADVDMNVIKTSDDRYVEIQATGEEATYNGEELMALLAMADRGLEALWDAQKVALDGAE